MRWQVLPTAVIAWSIFAALLFWGHLPGPLRRGLALVASLGGLVFLLLAMGTEGVRESHTTAAFLMGASYVTDQASASASLPYYVMTVVCLLLGTIGLALGDDAAKWLERHWLLTAVTLSLLVTALRFVLDKVAAPPLLGAVVGVVWLPPVVGAFFAVNLRREGKGVKHLLLALLAYALSVRVAVVGLMVLASTLRLGSHYDVSGVIRIETPFSDRALHFVPGSPAQVLELGVLPQLLFWPTFTVLLGLLGALALRLLEARLAGAGSATETPGLPLPRKEPA